MIREATEADIPRLLDMGARFAERAGLVDHVGYNPDDMADTFRLMIESEHAVIFIGESGAIGGHASPHPFNRAHWVAQEIFWWSEGREGLRLLQAYEDWAAERCQSVGMITLEAVEPDRTARLFERKGYRPLERTFLKVL